MIDIHLHKVVILFRIKIIEMTRYLVSAVVIAAISLLFFVGCANVGNPVGGIKDENPPVLVKSNPENFSTNFKENKFEIHFDEFIKFNDINNKLVVSPPLSKKPKVKLKGRYLVVEFKDDTLKENVTYTFKFDNAIQDNNEGNEFKDLNYVFSTGNKVDTLNFHGSIIKAFDHKADENVFVALYNKLTDSVPIVEKPLYITKADKETGMFEFNNIAEGSYKIFAFKELNNNYIYDQPGEAIAFSDELIEIVTPDENMVKEIDIKSDSTTIDDHQHITLFMFMEDRDQQYLKDYRREKQNKLTLEFNSENRNYIEITPLNFDVKKTLFKDYSIDKKTYDYWVADTTIAKQDTLKLKVDYFATDTLFKLSLRTDTLKFIQKKENKNKKEKIVPFVVQNNVTSSKLELFDSLQIVSTEPILNINKSLISLNIFKDSVEVAVDFKIVPDSTSILKKHIWFNKKQNAKYHLTALPGAFTSIASNINDTINVVFSVKELESYGLVKLNLKSDSYPQIIQLIKADKDKETVIREFFIEKDVLLTIPYLTPDKYFLKSVYDVNGNKKWDTGIYLQHIQPEEIRYLNKEQVQEEVIIKANWEVELDWNLILK